MVLKDKRDHCFFVCNLRPDFKKIKFDVCRSFNFLTFEGAATDSEFPLHFTFIHAILLLPEMFTRPRQDANDLFFILRP